MQLFIFLDLLLAYRWTHLMLINVNLVQQDATIQDICSSIHIQQDNKIRSSTWQLTNFISLDIITALQTKYSIIKHRLPTCMNL
jgi:hypothetical protein